MVCLFNWNTIHKKGHTNHDGSIYAVNGEVGSGPLGCTYHVDYQLN